MFISSSLLSSGLWWLRSNSTVSENHPETLDVTTPPFISTQVLFLMLQNTVGVGAREGT